MPYGPTNGGGGGSTFGGEIPMTENQRAALRLGKVKERVHALSYSATTNKLLLDVDTTQTEGSVKADTVGDITIQNTGGTPAFAILAYRLWTGAGVMSANTYYVNHLLKPGQSVFIPDTPAIIQDEDNDQYIGTAVDSLAPTAVNSDLLWNDIGADLGADVDATTDPITVTTDSNHTNFFRQGDLIQIGRGTGQTDLTEANHYREILRVQSITNSTTMVCERGLYGTSAGDNDLANWNQGHTSGFPIFLPFFNAYHDVDKFSVTQTDKGGKFKCFNFFGQGRAATTLQGITPGSVAIKFFLPGYQRLGLSGITSSTNSGLTAGETLKLDITVDGVAFSDLTFTLDSSNVNFGGTNGLISKIQDALDTQYYTAGNLFEKKVIVGIVDGDIRFTSGSHLSTSAILLADTGDSDSFIDAAANGRIPASGDIPSPVAAKLPDDVIYDPITYTSMPNTGAFGYDDGEGRLFGMCSGTINYETGAIDMWGCPANAEFVVTCLHTSPFSGKQDATDSAKMNKLKHIYGNTPNKKCNGELTITRT